MEEKENQQITHSGKDKKLPEKQEKLSAVLPEHTLNTINLFDSNQLAAVENFLTKVMRSDKGGIKSVNDGLAVLMRAQDLNLPFSTCIEHIHVINGKTGIDIHIIKSLLLRAGTITWECTKDYVPLYEYTDGINSYLDNALPDYAVKCANSQIAAEKAKSDEDSLFLYPVKWYQDANGNTYRDYQLNTKKFAIGSNKQQMAEIAQSGKIPVFRIVNQPVDYITEYVITRKIGDKEMKSVGRFSLNEARAAGLLEKDTYVKYAKILVSHRAFTYAARDIASDLIMGCRETLELKQMENIPITDVDIIEV